MHAHMSQAQAILRKSIRDTTADEEDPDRPYKDESESDSPKPTKAKGRGRGRGKGRGRKQKEPENAKDALETLETKEQNKCPEMHTHKLPQDMDAAAEQAAAHVAKDVKDTPEVASPEGDAAVADKNKQAPRTAAKTKATRKRSAVTPQKHQKKVALSDVGTGKVNEPQAAGPEEPQATEPSSGSKVEDIAATPEKPKTRTVKKGTPQKLKTPKTSPRKARKKKYQDSSLIVICVSFYWHAS